MSLISRRDACIEANDERAGIVNLLWEKTEGRLIECLDDGFVRLVDSMGGDDAVVRAARVSYGQGTKSVSDDRTLIRYLMRHRHSTPSEMVEFVFHVRIPMDAWRQFVRHRTFSINEYSTRYSEAIDSAQRTPPDQWRTQATNNKQGSGGFITEFPDGLSLGTSVNPDVGFVEVYAHENGIYDHTVQGFTTDNPVYTPGQFLTEAERQLQEQARLTYETRLKLGVAREQARKDLPLSTYTEAYVKMDLHNLLHFLSLRLDKHAQLEIRTYAEAMFALIKPIVPVTCEAFQDYRLDAITLSGPEIEEIKSILNPDWTTLRKQMSKREREELAVKLQRLGIEVE